VRHSDQGITRQNHVNATINISKINLKNLIRTKINQSVNKYEENSYRKLLKKTIYSILIFILQSFKTRNTQPILYTMKTDAFALRHIGPRENDVEHM
jgi:hypothetical protein